MPLQLHGSPKLHISEPGFEQFPEYGLSGSVLFDMIDDAGGERLWDWCQASNECSDNC